MKKYYINALFKLAFIAVNFILIWIFVLLVVKPVEALTETQSVTVAVEETIQSPTPIPEPRADITQKSSEVVEPLKKILDEQIIYSFSLKNIVKYAIRDAVNSGIPPNTIVLLLLLPGVATFIAGARHVIGIRGFGIFLPASLSVVFVAIGPVLGISLLLVIVVTSFFIRQVLKKSRIKLQYLPRMALILLFVVFAILIVLFSAPYIPLPEIFNVSIFPILILVLLAEEFTRIQLGKNIRIAISLTTETLVLALVSFMFMVNFSLQRFVLLNPEIYLLSLIIIDILMGKYIGLRFIELWRFRKIITK